MHPTTPLDPPLPANMLSTFWSTCFLSLLVVLCIFCLCITDLRIQYLCTCPILTFQVLRWTICQQQSDHDSRIRKLTIRHGCLLLHKQYTYLRRRGGGLTLLTVMESAYSNVQICTRHNSKSIAMNTICKSEMYVLDIFHINCTHTMQNQTHIYSVVKSDNRIIPSPFVLREPI